MLLNMGDFISKYKEYGDKALTEAALHSWSKWVPHLYQKAWRNITVYGLLM